MINLFDYTDFLKYFEDYYAWRKKTDPSFSYRAVAKKAGFNNKGFAYNLFHGKRHFSSANCLRISKALKHSRIETEYFKNLVSFNQTQDLAAKKRFFEKLCCLSAHGKGFSPAQVIAHDQYEYYSKWRHSAVRSLIGMYPFKDDYTWLAKMTAPPITPGQAQKSVMLLKRLGMVTVAPNGTLKLSHVSITTGPEIAGLGLRNFHFECADLAKKAICTMDRETRNITGLTLGVSKKTYKTICDEVAHFQLKLMAIANTDSRADRVYQINFHLFPLSKDRGKPRIRRKKS
jgi:uncharacterized protein (TIGR02147 family)